LPIVLVGSSDGGLNMRVYASEHESHVAGLVLVDAAHEDQAAKFAAAGFPSEPPAFARLVPAAAALGVLRLAGRPLGPRPEAEPEPVRRFVQATVYRTTRYRAMLDELTHFSESADEVRTLRRPLTIPVVVLSAGRSPIPDVTMPLQRDLLRLSPRSCQMVAAESGHDIAREAPDSVVRAIRVVIDAWRRSLTPAC
jgi:pimeloyl-ACP methyl ester carboxylesterase